MCGILEGLILAWNIGFRNVEVESDAAQTIERIDGHHSESYYLARQINELLNRRWETELMHTFRGGNQCAHKLATLSMKIEHDYVTWQQLPEKLKEILQLDSSGTVFPRRISVY